MFVRCKGDLCYYFVYRNSVCTLLGWGLLVVGETNVSVNDGLCIMIMLKTNQLFIIWGKMIE